MKRGKKRPWKVPRFRRRPNVRGIKRDVPSQISPECAAASDIFSSYQVQLDRFKKYLLSTSHVRHNFLSVSATRGGKRGPSGIYKEKTKICIARTHTGGHTSARYSRSTSPPPSPTLCVISVDPYHPSHAAASPVKGGGTAVSEQALH